MLHDTDGRSIFSPSWRHHLISDFTPKANTSWGKFWSTEALKHQDPNHLIEFVLLDSKKDQCVILRKVKGVLWKERHRLQWYPNSPGGQRKEVTFM